LLPVSFEPAVAANCVEMPFLISELPHRCQGMFSHAVVAVEFSQAFIVTWDKVEVISSMISLEVLRADVAVEMVKREGIRRWGQWSWMAFFYVVNDLENLSRKLNTALRLE
jgi:hypothetical protein